MFYLIDVYNPSTFILYICPYSLRNLTPTGSWLLHFEWRTKKMFRCSPCILKIISSEVRWGKLFSLPPIIKPLIIYFYHIDTSSFWAGFWEFLWECLWRGSLQILTVQEMICEHSESLLQENELVLLVLFTRLGFRDPHSEIATFFFLFSSFNLCDRISNLLSTSLLQVTLPGKQKWELEYNSKEQLEAAVIFSNCFHIKTQRKYSSMFLLTSYQNVDSLYIWELLSV